MLWVGSKPIDLYLGQGAVAVCAGSKVMLVAQVVGLTQALDHAKASLKAHGSHRALRVWLSGGLCRPFLVPEVNGINGNGEAQVLARAVASERTGMNGSCQVWMEPRRTNQIAVAVQDQTVAEVNAALHGLGRIRAIGPWWAEVLRHALALRPNLTGFGFNDCDSVTVLAGAGLSFSAASTIAPVSSRAAASAAWARTSLSSDMDPAHSVLWAMRQEPGLNMPDCALGPLVDTGA